MSASREYRCRCCGASLPIVIKREPVYIEYRYMTSEGVKTSTVLLRYEEREEPGECSRCTWGY